MRTMRTLGTLVVIGGTVGLVYGCSAAGEAPIGNDTADGSTPAANYGPGGDQTDSGSKGTTPKKDAGSTGGGGAYDAGPPKVPEGSPCNAATAFSDPQATESCGVCGTQTRACLSPDGGTSTVWGVWGSCSGEVTTADACDPSKTYAAAACGNCGTVQQVCGFDCHFESGFDCTEPAGACHPTDTKFVLGASCTTSGQGRLYTCSPACAYGTPSACELPPPNPNSLTLSATVGGTVSAVFPLAATSQVPSLSSGGSGIDSCPADVDTSEPTSGIYIGIVNPTARTITVSLWDGPAVSEDLDTVMAWYNTPVFPPPDLAACGFVNDQCSTKGAECSGSDWSALKGSEGPSIPPGGSITLYVGMYAFDSDSGNVKVYAKSEN